MPDLVKCDHCESEDVWFEAFVCWNEELQNWEIVNVFDECVCNTCGERSVF